VPTTPALILVAVLTTMALVVVVIELRAAVRAGEWDWRPTLGFLLVAASSSLVNIVVTALGQWTDVHDPFGQTTTTLPAWAYQLQLGLYLTLLVGSVVLAAVRATSTSPVLNIPAVFFLLLSLLSGASALLHGHGALRPFYLVFVAVLAATTLAPRGLGVHLGFAAFLAPAAVLSGLFVVVTPAFAAMPCGIDKCGLLGFNARGFFENENALALYLTLAMPFIYLAFRRVGGALVCAYVLFVVLLSGSRSGAIAGTVTFVLLLVVRPDVRRPSFSWPRATVLYGVLASAVALGVALPYTTQDPTAYTGRAYLWALARQMLSDGTHSLLGYGALGWEDVRQAGLIDFSAVYSVHNQWLQVLFSTGLVGIVLLVVGLALLVAQSGRRYALVVGCVLAPVLCLAPTERPWAIDVVDWLLWALPGALLCYPHVERPVPRGVEADGSAVQEHGEAAARPSSPARDVVGTAVGRR
jgi:O-Antigen ligase